jgi:hypothetical protein
MRQGKPKALAPSTQYPVGVRIEENTLMFFDPHTY